MSWIPAAIGLAGSLFGGGGPSPSEKANAKLTNLIAKQYENYAPQINSQLWNMAQSTPAWVQGRQSQSMQQAGKVLNQGTGNLLSQLQGNGMLDSGSGANMLSAMQLQGAQMMAQNQMDVSQMGEDRQLRLLQSIASMLSPNSAQQGFQTGMAAEQNRSNNFNSMMGLLGNVFGSSFGGGSSGGDAGGN